jgi:hypothetical protein
MTMQQPAISCRAIVAGFALVLAAGAFAQSTIAPAPAAQGDPAPAKAAQPSEANGPLAELAWLAGCWRGSVNQREFREHWLPLRGNLLVGAGHTVNAGRTQDFEYLRIEMRGNDLWYVASPSGGRAAEFRLSDRSTDGPDTIFTFASSTPEFPQRIVYRRGTSGWLYVHVEGKLDGQERKVIYPFRRVDCESGELIER